MKVTFSKGQEAGLILSLNKMGDLSIEDARQYALVQSVLRSRMVPTNLSFDEAAEDAEPLEIPVATIAWLHRAIKNLYEEKGIPASQSFLMVSLLDKLEELANG